MGLIKRIERGNTLVQGMADRLGADLPPRAGRDMRAEASTYAHLVMRCAGCSEHGACKTLQAQNEQLESAPDYCRNADWFKAHPLDDSA